MAEHEENIMADYNKAVSDMKNIQSMSGASEMDVLTFDFLRDHAAILMAHSFDFDWNLHVSKLFWGRDFVVSEILDADVVECIMVKEKKLWDCDDETNPSMVCHALLLTLTVNHSTVTPECGEQSDRVLSATVVWVASDQDGYLCLKL